MAFMAIVFMINQYILFKFYWAIIIFGKIKRIQCDSLLYVKFLFDFDHIESIGWKSPFELNKFITIFSCNSHC